jgi:uncharacterized protein YqgV (UPF0045/DUF77 family)
MHIPVSLTTTMMLPWLIVLAFLTNGVHSLSSPVAPKDLAGVRFSLYPKVKGEQSLKLAIKTAVSGLSDLGLKVQADDVSSVLLGPTESLFEAMRVAFGRACRVEGEPHVAMVCTFSANSGQELPILPPRTVETETWVEDANRLPSRIACQFAVYPLGSIKYQETMDQILGETRKSPVFKDDKEYPFCYMLDGDGLEVFDVLQSSFGMAKKQCNHVTMTVTLTANKNAWKKEIQ